MLLIRVVVAAIITLCVALIASPILALIGSNELVKTLYVITFIIGLFINPNDFLSKQNQYYLLSNYNTSVKIYRAKS